MEYSVDGGATWTQWVPGSDFPHEMEGAVVYVRAGIAGNAGFADPTDPSTYWHFTSDDLFSVSGNIMSLLSRDGSSGLTDYCFYGLFSGCTMLVDASGLELPATTPAYYCYSSMFDGCTSLTAAPALPATTLDEGCYANMFSGCASLADAPELPATVLADYCYQGMFQACDSLSSVDVSFTAWSPSNATDTWLNGVAASGTFTCPAALPDDVRDASHIPTDWTVVKPVAGGPLRFTALAANSGVALNYAGGDTSWTAPDLEYSTDGQTWTTYQTGDSVTLAQPGDYVLMRATAPNEFSKSRSNYFKFSLTGEVRASGDATMLLDPDGSVLSAHDQVFFWLFRGCSQLKDAADLKLPSLSVGSEAYNRMFDGTGISAAPELPATTLGANCYGNMFEGCRSLVKASDLPAGQLVQYCYQAMYSVCSSLRDGPRIMATSSTDNNQLDYMFYQTSNLSSVEVHFTSWSGIGT